MFRYKTVIFDLDGTLLDTLEDLTNSVNYALEKNGYLQRTLEEVRGFVGNGIGKLIERAVPEGVADSCFQKVLDDFTKNYKINCKQKTKPYEGIKAVLETLMESGIQMGIVSNKADYAVKELNDFYFNKYHMIAIGEKDNIKRKPAPDTVYTAMEQLEADASATIYVGDSDVDVRTAENAGLPCISVLWGFRDKEELEKCGAVKFAAAPKDLLVELTM